MIEKNDKIAVGLSGGKDSMALLLLLNDINKYFDIDFSLGAITIDLGFEEYEMDNIKNFCDDNNINLHVETTKISKIVFDIKKSKNPCSLCSNLRRGALNNIAKELGFNKVALGHNLDDVIETFFLSMLYEGRFSMFSPKTYLSRTDIEVIRPLIYCEEKELSDFIELTNFNITNNPCPADGVSKRQEVKELLDNIYRNESFYKNNIFNAIKNIKLEGW